VRGHAGQDTLSGSCAQVFVYLASCDVSRFEIMDPDNPYRYLAVRGRVAEITESGADAHIDMLAKKYLGEERYPYGRPGEVRVLYKIQPDRVSSMG